ncbi:MAG: hypothetical protein ABEJ99_00935 [Candidatus Nanohaloarchaea archaeon]
MTEGEQDTLQETDRAIQEMLEQILSEEEAALAMIAPYSPAKISPARAEMAQIGLVEELRLEYALKELEDVDKIKLLLHSYGGRVTSSFKIAQALIENFDQIEVYVPHLALSGGTLISLTGEKIVMGQMSQLSPLDPQYTENGKQYSVNALIRMFEKLQEQFGDTHEQDAPYPMKALVDKIDPVDLQEKIDSAKMMREHARDILLRHDFLNEDQADEILHELVTEYPTHEYCITKNEAANILPSSMICVEENHQVGMNVMRTWLQSYFEAADNNHIIKYHRTKNDDKE